MKTYTGLQFFAFQAFAKRTTLTSSRRRQLLSGFSHQMSYVRAWAVAKAFANGEVEETGVDLRRLIQSWLVLGQRKFETIFKVVIAVRSIIAKGLQAFGDIAHELKRVFSHITRRQIERVWREIVQAQALVTAPAESSIRVFAE